MRRVAIIGCGGINSWFVKYLAELCNVFDKKELIYVKLFDKDEIEEKNLLRNNQNFKIEDLMEQKAKVLAKRYNFDNNEVFITEENIDLLTNFDDIILGVDNNKTRKLIYEFAIKHGKYLLDLRAQGTQMAYYVLGKDSDMEYYNKKFFSNPDVMERKGSCQLTHDVENDHIENANKIIAHFGAFGVYFKYLRGETMSTNEWRFVY